MFLELTVIFERALKDTFFLINILVQSINCKSKNQLANQLKNVTWGEGGSEKCPKSVAYYLNCPFEMLSST
jgi:hypothetical protein